MGRRWTTFLVSLLALLLLPGGVHAARPAGWQRLANDPYGGLAWASATLGPDQRIYVMAERQLQRFEPRTHTWAALSDKFLGYHSGLVAIGNQLYAVGGAQWPPDAVESFTEVYSLRTGQWRYVARSHCAHAGSGVALGRDGRIYVGGGEIGDIGTCLEAYDPHHDRWTKLPYIPTPVFAPGVAAGLDGRIYFIGGLTFGLTSPAKRIYAGPPKVLHDVLVYDPRTNRWSTAAPMPTARVAPAALTTRDGTIYVIGGSVAPYGVGPLEHPQTTRTVEVYHPKTNQWSTGPSLRVPRVGLAAVQTPDGTIYAIGGIDQNAKRSSVVEALSTTPVWPK